MIAFSDPPSSSSSLILSGIGRIVASTTTTASRRSMPLVVPSTLAALSATSSSSTAAAAAAASTVATVMPPLSLSSSWASSVAGNRHWVGSAWIISSAILTTYSTTKFLKYEGGGHDDDTSPLHSISDKGSSTTFRQFRSILNPTNKKRLRHEEEEHQMADKKSTRGSTTTGGMSRASLLTLYRFSGSLLLGLLVHSQFYNLGLLVPRFLDTVHSARSFLLPSLFLFVANYTNSIALDRIGISLTYTSKCGIPLMTVLLTLLLDGASALPSARTLLSLLPIALGIGAASWNSPTFETLGFLAALASTTSQAALNVVSKRVMRRTGVGGVDAQRAMVMVALGIGLVMAAANRAGGRLREIREYGANVRNVATADADDDDDGGEEGGAAPYSTRPPSPPPVWLACLAVLAYHMEYVLSFSFVGLVEPITYGTCDAIRRLLIIITGRRMFGGDKFSKSNLGGIFLALLGASMYSITSARGV